MVKWVGRSTDRVWRRVVEADNMLDLFWKLDVMEVISDEDLLSEAKKWWPEVAKLDGQRQALLEEDSDEEADKLWSKESDLIYSNIESLDGDELEDFIKSFTAQAFYQEIIEE